MPGEQDLRSMEVICKREECGDPVTDRGGTVHYTKRRLNFVKLEGFSNVATFECPVCGKKRKFRLNPLTNEIREVKGWLG